MRASACARHYRVFPSIVTCVCGAPAFYFIPGDEGALSRSLFAAILAAARSRPSLLACKMERWLAAIVAADLVGCSLLMGEDAAMA
jgi:hypothetical protein